MVEDVRNFGPLLPKINGKEYEKFAYLRLENSLGALKVISIDTEELVLVRSIKVISLFITT